MTRDGFYAAFEGIGGPRYHIPNVLWVAGVRDVEDLARMSDADLLAIPHFGVVSLARVRRRWPTQPRDWRSP